jgi:transposase
MKSTTIWVGLDVHKESISVAVLEGTGAQGRPVVTIPNDPAQVRKLFARLKKEGEVHACYEAGSCGYEVYRQLATMGIGCDVVAPGLIPVRVGDRVKTDRRDAEKLPRLFRAGELTSIRVPTEAEEALRDLMRCREDAREDVLRQRHHVLKFLLRHGRIFHDTKHWTLAHWRWLRAQRFDQPLAQTVFTEYLSTLEKTLARVAVLDQEIAKQADKEPYSKLVGRLRCLRGIDTQSAMVLIAEICDFGRFEHPRELMAFLGLVPSERSSGGKQRRGSITKTGNSHARRIVVEAAWHYRHAAARSATMKARWKDQPPGVVDHAYKAQERLHRRYFRLTSRGKPSQVAAIAVARELCGFVWAVARNAA